MNLSEHWLRIRTNHFMRYGLPFIVFITGGSFVLKQFASVRYEVSRHNKQLGITPELLKEVGFEVKGSKTLEEEYTEMVKKVDFNNWKNVRAPRPWEDNKEYKEVIEQRIAEQQRDKYRVK